MLTFDEFVGGWLAGIAGLYASHPFDTIKIRQHDTGGKSITFVFNAIRYEGICALYKGITGPALLAGISNGIFFGIYSNIFRYMIDKSAKQHIPKNDIEMFPLIFGAGVFAGAFQIVLTTPVENIKIQKQMHPTFKRLAKNCYIKIPPLSYFKCCKEIYITMGWKGFFRGFVPCFYRDVPTGGLYMTIYIYNDKFLCNYISEYWSHLISGGISGLLSYAPVNPFDVIKTRMQSDYYHCPKYSGFIDCIKKTYKERGMKIFWRGFWPNSIRSFVNNGTVFVIFELYIMFSKSILKHEL